MKLCISDIIGYVFFSQVLKAIFHKKKSAVLITVFKCTLLVICWDSLDKFRSNFT